VIKQRLEELGLEQRNLAAAVGVTESYISQLLSGKKSPPAPGRTEIYGKMGKYLKFPGGELAKLADHQRREELKRSLGGSPAPLFGEVREMILVKCRRDNAKQIRAIFEKEPFGELEQLVTQKLLDVVKRVVHAELESETWLRSVARLSGRSYYEMRISLVEFMCKTGPLFWIRSSSPGTSTLRHLAWRSYSIGGLFRDTPKKLSLSNGNWSSRKKNRDSRNFSDTRELAEMRLKKKSSF